MANSGSRRTASPKCRLASAFRSFARASTPAVNARYASTDAEATSATLRTVPGAVFTSSPRRTRADRSSARASASGPRTVSARRTAPVTRSSTRASIRRSVPACTMVPLRMKRAPARRASSASFERSTPSSVDAPICRAASANRSLPTTSISGVCASPVISIEGRPLPSQVTSGPLAPMTSNATTATAGRAAAPPGAVGGGSLSRRKGHRVAAAMATARTAAPIHTGRRRHRAVADSRAGAAGLDIESELVMDSRSWRRSTTRSRMP